MKTKYILHGGNAQEINEENILFFDEILRDFSDKVNVLLIQFAAIKEKQEIYKQRHINQFERVRENRKIDYKVATLENLIQEIKLADVIYLCGSSGGTPRLLSVLRQFENISDLFKGKTVAGESAGANCLTSFCFSKSGGVLQALGSVPIRFIPHYEIGMEKELIEIHKELTLLVLPNYKFKVFELEN